MNEPPHLDLHKASEIEPARYSYPAPALLFVHSMACDVPRSIAMICYDHALRLLTLEEDKAKLVPVDNTYLSSIAGGQISTVEPARNPRELAYLQSRRIVFYELSTKKNANFRVIDDSEMELLAVAGGFAQQPNLLVVQIEDTSRYVETNAVQARLLAAEIGEGGIRRLGTLDLEDDAAPRQDWGAGRGIVVVFKDGFLEVYSPALVPLRGHPLGIALRALFEERRALRFQGFAFHPLRDTLVFALLERDREGARDYSIYRVDFDEQLIRIRPIASVQDVGEVRFGSYSPDGARFLIHVLDEGRTYVLLASLESEELPAIIGGFSALKSTHFALAPLSVVVMDDDLEVVADYPITSIPEATQGI